jgi:hypothetical protein
MVLLSVHVVSVRIRRITLPQGPFTSTYFNTVSCPTIIVGPSTEKLRGATIEDNEEKEDDDNYPGFPEYGDTFMGEAEGEAREEAHDEPADDLVRTIADAQREWETKKEREWCHCCNFRLLSDALVEP